MINSSVYQFLLDSYQKQLQSSKITSDWFDPLIIQLKDQIAKSNMGDAFTIAADAALNTIVQNKTKVIDLGAYGLTLFIFQVGLGQSQAATETYIQALTNPEDLIALMNSGTQGVIQAKQKLDQIEAEALSLIETIGIDLAKALIPLLLTLI